jgi:hypothetical protein
MDEYFKNLIKYNYIEYTGFIQSVNMKFETMFNFNTKLDEIDVYMVELRQRGEKIMHEQDLRYSGLVLNDAQIKEKTDLQNKIYFFVEEMIIALKRLKIELDIIFIRTSLLEKIQNE